MYHPYLRGKQYELIALRENAGLVSGAGMHPIIEPVRADLGALRRAIDALSESGAGCTVVVNPRVGEIRDRLDFLMTEVFANRPSSWARVEAGFYVHPETQLAEVSTFLAATGELDVSLVHGGFPDGAGLAAAVSGAPQLRRNVFLDGETGRLYRRHFPENDAPRVLIRDGFKQQQKNSQYPESDHFSDLHVTFADERMSGFGDYLTVGDSFSESGGPAYAVAIHLTYLDREGDMHTFHFVSDQTDSPTNPGGKFLEALAKLVAKVEERDSQVLRTRACEEFLSLYAREYYPGLGYVKKLSMQHHLELMSSVTQSGGPR